MYGWIHLALEKLILLDYGDNKWKEIKNIARCKVKTGDWLRYENYSDEETFALIDACTVVLKMDADAVFELLGQYFIEYICGEGYFNMLSVLGANLREWLGNINDLHAHLQSSLPGAKFPEYWCVNDEEADPQFESMILHYYSQVYTHHYLPI